REFFLLMFSLPPLSLPLPLFPYTTLFRSAWAAEGLATTCSRGAAAVAVACEFPSFCPSGNEPHFSQNFAPTERAAPQFVQKVGADRKSTRLNSSHLGISYAVFCLKKKMK